MSAIAALIRWVDRLTAERDELEAAADEWRQRSDENHARYAMACNMATSVLADRIKAWAERDQARVEVDRLTAERDQLVELATARLTDRQRIAAERNQIRDHARFLTGEVADFAALRKRVLALVEQYEWFAEAGAAQITYEPGELARVLRTAVNGPGAEPPYRHANGQPCHGCQIRLDEEVTGDGQ